MMKLEFANMKSPHYPKPLPLLLIIVAVNYVAQIPYYIHQYYAPHRLLPDLGGSLLLLATLVWFLVAYRLLARRSLVGWWLMTAYLLVVFLFYMQTQVVQLATTHQILLYVYHPGSPLLFAVFGIGYINCIAAACYLVYLITRRSSIVSAQPKP